MSRSKTKASGEEEGERTTDARRRASKEERNELCGELCLLSDRNGQRETSEEGSLVVEPVQGRVADAGDGLGVLSVAALRRNASRKRIVSADFEGVASELERQDLRP